MFFLLYLVVFANQVGNVNGDCTGSPTMPTNMRIKVTGPVCVPSLAAGGTECEIECIAANTKPTALPLADSFSVQCVGVIWTYYSTTSGVKDNGAKPIGSFG